MRIVGGFTASTAEIPWICIFEKRNEAMCGVSIIAPRWNVGASHCVSQVIFSRQRMVLKQRKKYAKDSEQLKFFDVFTGILSKK